MNCIQGGVLRHFNTIFLAMRQYFYVLPVSVTGLIGKAQQWSRRWWSSQSQASLWAFNLNFYLFQLGLCLEHHL